MLDQELISLVKKIKIKVLEKNYTIAVAESCTGGLVSGCLTSIPGASDYFSTGIVSYSNEAKISILKVPQGVLDQFGAVSEETAKFMAIGVSNIAKSNIAISVTGIAGPGAGTDKKPVGTICFGMYANKILTSSTEYFSGNREEIRYLASRHALVLILEELNSIK